jgi:hypothetical protein
MEPDFIQHWDQLDELAADLARTSEGKVWPTLAVSFVGHRPDLVVEAPHFVGEDADEIVAGLIDFFGALRPDRLAVLWPNVFDVDGEQVLAVRVNSAEPAGRGRWVWRTRLHPYTVDRDLGTVELGPPFDLARPPDPWSRRLRALYARRTWRRIQARGWFAIPDAPGWTVAAHPDSTTLDGFERLDA